MIRIKTIFIILCLLSISSCQKRKIVEKEMAPEHKIIFKIRHDHFKSLPKKAGQTVFIGHSIIQYGNWDEIFPDHKIINRGIGGSSIEAMTDVIAEELSYKPKSMFIMIGINDIGASYKTDKIDTDYSRLFEIIKKQNHTKIYYLSILPSNAGMKNAIDRANSFVKTLCDDNVIYIDLNPAFSDQQGFFKKEYTIDDVHLSGKGYLKLGEILTPYLN